MYGATQDEIGSLTTLAKSWVSPPKLVIKSGSAENHFDSTQRCYVISDPDENEIDNLEFSLEANSDRPVFNPVFVIRNWGEHEVQLKINGKELHQGNNLRIGHVRRINQYDLVVWLELESESRVEITMEIKEWAH
jgi:hypothetical protein